MNNSIGGRRLRHFNLEAEFTKKGIDIELIQPRLLWVMDDIRDALGYPIYPSTAPGAWGRTDGPDTSRHYAVDRKADAGDVFPARGRAGQAWMEAIKHPDVGGLGFYMDTRGPDGQEWPMLHIDLRPGETTLWCRVRRSYVCQFLHPEIFNLQMVRFLQKEIQH